MSYAIEVNHISKRFLLGSDSIKNLLLDRKEKEKRTREFWALKDVSFVVEPGTALGIVGHNGSGKSTMLKVLTGILDPTQGSITTRGRIGALIEVGAGFHPDLSGRENVFLNGSILGLSEREITRRMDEIVDFAGLEQFMDTPVKRYSSGMYMRLGFAIAANVNPDILIIDEVLAVGDTQFQNKCLRRMQDFIAQGGTVVFVSHAMGQVASLCQNCVWLDHGQLFYQGPTEEAVGRYMALVAEREEEEFKRKHPQEWAIQQEESRRAEEKHQQRRAEGPLRITGVELYDREDRPCRNWRVGDRLTVRVGYKATEDIRGCGVGISLNRTPENIMVYGPNTVVDQVTLDVGRGAGVFELSFDDLALLEGDYAVHVSISDKDGLLDERHGQACAFRVRDERHEPGLCRMSHVWRHEIDPDPMPVGGLSSSLERV